MSGLRAGMVVFVGVGIANLCSYGFHLVSARTLGPSSYGRRDARGRPGDRHAAVRRGAGLRRPSCRIRAGARAPPERRSYVSGFYGAMAVVALVRLILILVAPLVKSALGIASLSAVILAAVSVAPAVVAPALVGAAQGVQRFVLLGPSRSPHPPRCGSCSPRRARGRARRRRHDGGDAADGVVAIALPLVALRGGSRTRAGGWRPRLARPDASPCFPSVAGMLAITCLTTDDLVAAKATLLVARGGAVRCGFAHRPGDPLSPARDRHGAAPAGGRRRLGGPRRPHLLRRRAARHRRLLSCLHGDLRRVAAPDRADRVRLEVRRKLVDPLDVRDLDDPVLVDQRGADLPARARRDAYLMAPPRRRRACRCCSSRPSIRPPASCSGRASSPAPFYWLPVRSCPLLTASKVTLPAGETHVP